MWTPKRSSRKIRVRDLAPRFKGLLRSFAKDQSGVIAIIFCLCSTMLIMCAGLTIDIGNAYRMQSVLQNLADAAILAEIAESSQTFATAAAMTSDGPVSGGNTAATEFFDTQATQHTGAVISQVTAQILKSKRTITGTLHFVATVPTYFLAISGITSITVTGTGAGTNVLPTYIDFYLALDNSPSMGVAATPTNVATMVANTPDQCAFACHDLSTSNNYYNLAKKLGVTTRIDVLRTATQQLMTTAQQAETVSDQFRMAVYTFNTSIQSIAGLTSNLSSASSLSANIDLMAVPYQNWNNDQDTNYDAVLPALNNVLPNEGTGASPSDTQKVLFFVSDGVSDESKSGSRVIAPINTALCNTIKSRGIQIAVLYTTYLPLPTNAFYNQNVAPWIREVNPAMSACATPGLFFEVSPTQGIADAMNALFLKIVGQAHLTN